MNYRDFNQHQRGFRAEPPKDYPMPQRRRTGSLSRLLLVVVIAPTILFFGYHMAVAYISMADSITRVLP